MRQSPMRTALWSTRPANLSTSSTATDRFPRQRRNISPRPASSRDSRRSRSSAVRSPVIWVNMVSSRPGRKIPLPYRSVGSGVRENLELNVSRDFFSNDIDGSGGATLPVPDSGFNVSEIFTEVKVPIIQGMPWAEDLSFNGGYRYSSYNTAGSTNAWKAGLEWQPIDDVRFRASQDRAGRAPTVVELFARTNFLNFR